MVGELAEQLDTSPVEIIKQLMRAGIMASINQTVEFDVASGLAKAYGFTVEEEGESESEARSLKPAQDESANLVPRAPVVAFLGHVDHGKTSLLDYIRKSRVAAGEAGGITQRIGAYQADVDGQTITFLDTPGHEAFTALRARGAQVTDIAVLVVAAEDGVMPQTIEAINHIQAAEVPMIVAINKIDLPGADLERVRRELSQQNVLVEDWGGEIVSVPVSATTGEGIESLLESIVLVAEIEELKGDVERPFTGVVIESRLDANRGPLATVLVQGGTLRPGATVVAGTAWGRVRAMLDYQGKRLETAELAVPLELLGLNGVPQAGDLIEEAEDERTAKDLAESRETQAGRTTPQVSILEQVSAQVREGETPELIIIIKADYQGSLEAVRATLEDLSSDRVHVTILHGATGSISESDVFLAAASNALIVGFNTRVEPGARRLSEIENVDIRTYSIIYRLIEDVTKAVEGLAKPITERVLAGKLEVRQIFTNRRTNIAGCLVMEGQARRGAEAAVMRRGRVLHQSAIATLRHFRDDVREVASGQECGVTVEGFNEFEEGDVVEIYRTEERA